jgi:AraC family transcriptional regulator, regulatory protein of adaptative response / DNA-3-methyladenine glycosylase II
LAGRVLASMLHVEFLLGLAGSTADTRQVHEDTERCVRAVQSKDARFDGWFFTAVLTTGIYCRPSCPATVPKPQNMRFFPSAAAAQQAGFRACKRCRPDASPGSPLWNERADLVARAMRLIADGVVDRDGVAGLAGKLGYSVRQIERQLRAELGAGPLALARAQRAQTARLLIETTALPMGDIAFAAGFPSIRTFNDTVLEVFALAPTDLRRRARASKVAADAGGSGRAGASASLGLLSLRLPFRAPMCPDNLFGHLVATAVPGVEEWRDGSYRRTLRLPHGPGVVALRPCPDYVACQLALTDLRDLAMAISRCRRLLDLDADPVAVCDQLRGDAVLAPLVDKAPGRRIPRTVDAAEFAIRAVLGQQVSTAAARTHAARLATSFGEPVEDQGGGLTRLFPEMTVLAQADQETVVAMPQARKRTLIALAQAIAAGDVDLAAGADWQVARSQLATVPGLGPWTIEVIAMRGLGDPDAFPATDLGVRYAARALDLPGSPAALIRRAEPWRPWRGYAVQYLWATSDHAINQMPAD